MENYFKSITVELGAKVTLVQSKPSDGGFVVRDSITVKEAPTFEVLRPAGGDAAIQF